MKKKNIVFFTDAICVGGAEIYLVRLLKGLDKNKYEITLLFYDFDDQHFFEGELQSEHIEIIRIPKRNSLNALKLLYNYFKKSDYIHFNFLNPNRCKLPLLLSFLFPRKKLVGTLHLSMPILSHYPLKPQIMRVLLSLLYKNISIMICVSEENKNFFCKYYWFDKNKCVVIYNGIDAEKYQITIDKNSKRKELGLSQDDVVFITIARLCEQKGHIYLIEAIRKIIPEFPEAKFLFVGDGELRDFIQSKIKAYNLQNNVLIIGFRNDIPELLQISDCMVLSSIWEGFPYVVIEAMAAGVPVIAPAVNGVPEAVENGSTGFLIPPRDSEILQEKISIVLKDKNTSKNFSSNARSKVRQFTYEKMIRETEEIFDK